MRSAVLVVGLVACGDPESSAYEPANLELASVALDEADGEFEGVRRDWLGSLSVEGTGQDYTLSVQTTTAGVETVDLHSPGHSDLGALDGLTGVHVSIAPDPLSDELSLSIVDEAGALLYLVEPVEAGLLTSDQFGQGLVASGADLGLITVDAFELSLTSALFRTDTGDVELLPGEPQEVTIEGVSYRVVLIAGYDAELLLEGDVRCTGAVSRVAFEMARVDPGTADLAPIVRPEGATLPLSECTAAP